MLTPEQLKLRAINLEARLAGIISDDVEKIRRHPGGDSVATEFVLSVAALMSARAVAMCHVWTTEKVSSIRSRLFAAFDDDLPRTLNALKERLTKQGTIAPEVFGLTKQ